MRAAYSPEQKRIIFRSILSSTAFLLSVIAYSSAARSQEENRIESLVFGMKLRAGGQFDNIRPRITTTSDVGPAAGISFITELGLTDILSIHMDLPVVVPIAYGAMLKIL